MNISCLRHKHIIGGSQDKDASLHKCLLKRYKEVRVALFKTEPPTSAKKALSTLQRNLFWYVLAKQIALYPRSLN